jgi:hypothetical protein
MSDTAAQCDMEAIETSIGTDSLLAYTSDACYRSCLPCTDTALISMTLLAAPLQADLWVMEVGQCRFC